jgi:hypothetical protein
MNRMRLASILAAGSLAFAASSAAAQEGAHQSVLTTGEVNALVEARTRSMARERSALQGFLERDEVRAIGERAGIDIRDMRSAVATLDDDEVARLAPRIRDSEAALAGGETTVVIGTTALIIGLLILIVILVS